MTASRRAIVYCMLFIMLIGIIMLMAGKFSPVRPGIQDMGEAIHVVDSTKLLSGNPAGRITDLYTLMQLKSQTDRILMKDTLTRQDSIFLEEVNQKLNRILYEEDFH